MPVDAAIISGLLTTLAPLIRDEFSLFWSFKKEVQKLSNTLSSLNATLKDAEKKNLCKKDDQTEDWLRKLKDVAYEVRDIVDECTFEDLRLQVKRLNASSSSTRIQVTNSITHPFTNTWMCFKIGHKIKDVQEKLDQISSERIKFQLTETTRDLTVGGRETMSLLSVNVYGRDEDRKKIVDILVDSSNNDKRFSVLSIIGIGGLGKTTLAQLVFNDEKVDKYFDIKFWVCISEEFDIIRVMKDIIGDKSEASLEELQKKVRIRLNGKRYLIVLDDVWNEDENKWDTLRSVLDCGSDGAFVLATTRKRKVAEIMKTNQHFELSPLSEDACWLLFKERAFRDETSQTPNLICIGLEIAKKCKGVPLVAKTLGAQLGFQSDVKEWCRVRDSEMWKLSQNEEYDILFILRLSYYHLPYDLRRCFAFCAIFPKDTQIEKKRLVQLWMAHDLIPIDENQEVEDVGNKIWDELCWRSFFQDEKEEISLYLKEVEKTCKMHDLMHDLAQSIMKEECYTMDSNSSGEDFGREICHVTIMANSFRKTSIDSLKKIRGLQSIIFHPHNYRSDQILSVLKKLPSLRVLEASLVELSQDLSYTGCLKHLRFLNLSFSRIKVLPNSICDLLNLQTLNLNQSSMESLPTNTKNLINLRHLHLRNCRRLKCMPRGMGKLRHLKTLSIFVVGKESDGQLDELKELDIGGYMEIKNLECVSDASVVRGGISMSKKSSINQLVLHWNNDSRRIHDDNETERKSRDEKICEALEVRAATGLKTLEMCGYKGVNIPQWVGESYASLMRIELRGMENVEHIFTMNTSANYNYVMNGMLFPLLEYLSIKDMNNLRELVFPPIPITTRGAFLNLQTICIHNCPLLEALPLHLKSLKTLEVHRCPVLGALPPHLKSLKNLEVHRCPMLRALPPHLKSLKTLGVHRCPMLGALPAPHLKSLKTLKVKDECTVELFDSISDLSGLTRLSLNNIVNERSVLFRAAAAASSNINDMNGTVDAVTFPFLEELFIEEMKNLREFVSPDPIPITAAAFPNLLSIHIFKCPKLGALPPHLKSLKYVNVGGECSDELLYSISNLTALTNLSLSELGERSVLFGGVNYYKANEITSSSSRTLIEEEEEEGEPASTFQSLQSLKNSNCSKLSRLFDDNDHEEEGCEKLARRGGGGGGGGSCLTNLNSLTIYGCPELMISVEQWRNLITDSLQYLDISHCPKLVPISKIEEGEEAYDDDVMALLRSLRERLGSDNFGGDILKDEDERSEKKKKKKYLSILCN